MIDSKHLLDCIQRKREQSGDMNSFHALLYSTLHYTHSDCDTLIRLRGAAAVARRARTVGIWHAAAEINGTLRRCPCAECSSARRVRRGY